MKFRLLILSAVLILGINFMALNAQVAVTVTGGEGSGSGGSMSYSLGQLVYKTLKSKEIKISEGVEQAILLSKVYTPEKSEGITCNIQVYPNPTMFDLQLQIKDDNLENYYYQIYNLKGELLEMKKVLGNKTLINTDRLEPSTYFLKVIQDKNEVHTVKIIKK
jgi:hypothetical protein